GEPAVVDAHLVGTGATEPRALAEPRATAGKGAILPADAGARALRVVRARGADAVARVAAVVAARVAVRAIGVARARDAGMTDRRRRIALRRVGRDERDRQPVGAVGLELGDAAEAGDEAGEIVDRTAARRPTRHLHRRAIGRGADRRRRQVVAAAAPAVATAARGADGSRHLRRR